MTNCPLKFPRFFQQKYPEPFFSPRAYSPIYISPPTKVKKLGVVTQIIASIYNERTGNIDLGQSMPELQAYSDDYTKSVKSTITKSADGTIDSSATTKEDADAVIATTAIGYDLLVMNNVGQVIDKGVAGAINWNKIIQTLPGKYSAGLSRILLNRQDINTRVSGTFAINELNENQLKPIKITRDDVIWNQGQRRLVVKH